MPKGGPGKLKSEEHKAKIRAWWSAERRAEHGQKILGRKHSDETKRKIGEAHKGRVLPKEQAEKLRMLRLGVKLTEERKRAISRSLLGNQHTKGRRLSSEHKAKLSRAGKGRVFSEEHKAKIRASWKDEKRRAAASLRGKTRGGWKAANKSHRSQIELVVEGALRVMGVEYEAQATILECPYVQWDFVIHDQRLLIEIDGCYWHGCQECGFEKNPSRTRDRRKNTYAKKYGWQLVRIWGHDVESGVFVGLLERALNA